MYIKTQEERDQDLQRLHSAVCISGMVTGTIKFGFKPIVSCAYCGSSFLSFGIVKCESCGAPFREDDFYEYNY